MKKYIWLYVIVTAMILIGLFLSIRLNEITPNQDVNYVEINRIVKQLNNGEMPTETFYQYVISENEELREDLITQGYIPMDIKDGKVYIEVYKDDRFTDTQLRLSITILIAFILLGMLSLIFLLMLHKILIKPFNRLEKFAYKISVGNFDEPLPMDKNNTFGLFTQTFDIMRESLLEAQRSRNKIELAQKELIASLSHDIKTPITSIQLMTELLQAINDNDKNDSDNYNVIAETLETIETKTTQIDLLVSDLLNSALEELGELKVSVTTTESKVLPTIFQNNDPSLKIRIGTIPVCLIEIDVMRMEQIVGNIITNSYKYADTYIDVDFKVNGKYLQININDYGKGIHSEEQELIFTKFYRGENAKNSQREGEGLGLYISKILMEKMGGGIEAFNRTDGFTVRMSLCLSR